MSPSASCRRWSLNQPMYSRSRARAGSGRQTRSAISSVLKQSTKLPPARCHRHRRPTRSTRAPGGRPAPGCSPRGVLRTGVGVRHQLEVGAGLAESRAPSAGVEHERRCACCAASCQPTILRLNTSITNAKYTIPSQQRRYVKSPTHKRSGAGAVKSRLTRSCGLVAVGSGLVVRHGFPRRFAPDDPVGGHQPLHPAARHALPGASAAPSTSAGTHRQDSWPRAAARIRCTAAARPPQPSLNAAPVARW